MRPLVYDLRFRERAQRDRGTGLVLLLIAVGLWFVCVWQLLMPYDSTYRGKCDGPLFADDARRTATVCDTGRRLAWPLGLLALSVPVSLTGGVLYTGATTRLVMSEHAAEMERLAQLHKE
ncbi:hypothetical protein U9R90_31915 [Streptomyces sp. E11-3]|uniref:hypothetical protein n=1 Tax=Streptomyces sp. E11-3 TaxID=3110112 RepID=UPI0039811E8E